VTARTPWPMCASTTNQLDANEMAREEADRSNTNLRLAYGIDKAAEAISLSRARLYELIGTGEIGVCKVGKRTIIPATELTAFLDRHRVNRLSGVSAVQSLREKGE
jgi:excisionase family DNA binding protein